MSVLLAFGCGDSVGPAGDDEAAGDTTGTGGEGSGGSGNAEAGSQGNDANTDDAEGSGEGGSGSSAGTASGTNTDTNTGTDAGTGTDGTDETATMGGDSTETGEPPPNCLLLDEPTCNGIETCVPYMGQPYTESISGTPCLGEPQFIGCLFAIDACLPATGTLCMGEQAYHVDSLCPPPEGFASCDPPADPVMDCI
ncbi:hypothetical protein ACNOYE_04025 [Nannocystaceae bacterium ST9]